MRNVCQSSRGVQDDVVIQCICISGWPRLLEARHDGSDWIPAFARMTARGAPL